MNATGLIIERLREARKKAECSPHTRFEELIGLDMAMRLVWEVQSELACKSLAEAGY